MFTITINDGPMTAEDNVVYFCEEVHVEVELIGLPSPDDLGPDKELPIKWIVFVPNNGRQSGKLCKVPFERLVMISGDVQ